MERLLLTLVVLVVIGAAAGLSELPGLEAQSYQIVEQVQSQQWVRTTQGWERATWSTEEIAVPVAPPSSITRLDPRIVGSLQLLLSLVALLAWTRRA